MTRIYEEIAHAIPHLVRLGFLTTVMTHNPYLALSGMFMLTLVYQTLSAVYSWHIMIAGLISIVHGVIAVYAFRFMFPGSILKTGNLTVDVEKAGSRVDWWGLLSMFGYGFGIFLYSGITLMVSYKKAVDEGEALGLGISFFILGVFGFIAFMVGGCCFYTPKRSEAAKSLGVGVQIKYYFFFFIKIFLPLVLQEILRANDVSWSGANGNTDHVSWGILFVDVFIWLFFIIWAVFIPAQSTKVHPYLNNADAEPFSNAWQVAKYALVFGTQDILVHGAGQIVIAVTKITSPSIETDVLIAVGSTTGALFLINLIILVAEYYKKNKEGYDSFEMTQKKTKGFNPSAFNNAHETSMNRGVTLRHTAEDVLQRQITG